MKSFYALAFALAAFVAAGCGGGGEQAASDSGAAAGASSDAAVAVVDAATAGSVAGSVMFVGMAPETMMIDMSEEMVCAEKGERYGETVAVNDNGTLANVFVYVKEGLEGMSFPAPQEPVVLDQNGCWYIPRVLGIQVGQELSIRNSDGVLHNINAKPTVNRGFNISQPVVMDTKRSFRAAEVMVPLECDVHGWMQAFVGVLDHPYYSTTGAEGGFSLAPLPPGTYVIEAWHEVYGAQTQQVTVGEGETIEISFTFGEPAA
jgi:hypothetical protein